MISLTVRRRIAPFARWLLPGLALAAGWMLARHSCAPESARRGIIIAEATDSEQAVGSGGALTMRPEDSGFSASDDANPARMLAKHAADLLAHLRNHPDQLARADLLRLAVDLGRQRDLIPMIREAQDELASRRLAAIWYESAPNSFRLEDFGGGGCGAAAAIGMASIIARTDPEQALRLMEENAPLLSRPGDDICLAVFANDGLRQMTSETARWVLGQDVDDPRWQNCFRMILRDLGGSGSEEVVSFLERVQNPQTRERMALGAIGGAMNANRLDEAWRYADFLVPDQRDLVRAGITARRQSGDPVR